MINFCLRTATWNLKISSEIAMKRNYEFWVNPSDYDVKKLSILQNLTVEDIQVGSKRHMAI